MSSGSKQQTTTTDMPGWMQPYGKEFLGKAQEVASRPYTPYTGQTVAGMDPTTRQGLDMQTQLGQGGTAAGNAGQKLLTDTLSGSFMGSNPYLQSQIDRAQGDVVRNYNNVVKPATETAMARSGSFGNSGLMQMQQQGISDLQRNLGDISSGMRFNAYNTERQNQQQALGMTPAFNTMAFGNAQALQDAGRVQQGQQQAELTDAYQRFLQQQGWDANQLGVMGNALGVLSGNRTTTQSGGGPSPFGSVAGGAMAGNAIMPGWGGAIGAGLGYIFR